LLPEENVELERLLAAQAERGAVVDQFLTTVVVVPNVADPAETGNLSPLVLDADGMPGVVVCTNAEVARGFADRAPYLLTMAGVQLVIRLRDGAGLLLFGPDGGMRMEPALLTRIRADVEAMARARDGGQGGSRA
jgi:hypothetical protein